MTNKYISITLIYAAIMNSYRAVPDFIRRKMLALLLMFTVIKLTYSLSICEIKTCVCRYKNVQDQDYGGDSIQCLYSDTDLLEANHTLPDFVHSLDLSSNSISKVQHSPLLKSTTMAELLLNNNIITEISTTAFVLPELQRLDLSSNLLSFIDRETFIGVKKLEYLNLADNKFTTLSNLMFRHLSVLNQIVLDNNNIGRILQRVNLFDRSGFGLTRKIQNISMSRINFGNVPSNFFVDAYDLRKLVITNNNITDIFEIPMSLEYLDLSDNPISELSNEDFSDVPDLRVLKLNNLLIKEVPEYVFEPLLSLKKLELARNKNLTQISSLAFGEDVLNDATDFPLEELSLKGSRLTKLDATLMEPFARLTQLDLQGNPWQCDCQIKWVKELQIPSRYTDHVRCGSPGPLFNAKIFELKDKYFSCADKQRHIGILLALATVCLFLGMTGLWIFWCLPKRQSRAAYFRDMYAPIVAYSALPMSPNTGNI